MLGVATAVDELLPFMGVVAAAQIIVGTGAKTDGLAAAELSADRLPGAEVDKGAAVLARADMGWIGAGVCGGIEPFALADGGIHAAHITGVGVGAGAAPLGVGELGAGDVVSAGAAFGGKLGRHTSVGIVVGAEGNHAAALVAGADGAVGSIVGGVGRAEHGISLRVGEAGG